MNFYKVTSDLISRSGYVKLPSSRIGEGSSSSVTENFYTSHPEDIRKGISDCIFEVQNWNYGDPRGDHSLRRAFIDWFGPSLEQQERLIEQSIVTSGSKQGIWLAMLHAAAGTETFYIPKPGWAPYELIAKSLDKRVVYYDPQDLASHPLSLDDSLKKHQLDNSRVTLVINYPNNPTGAVAKREWLKLLVENCIKRDIQVVSDETYFALSDSPTSLLHIDGFDHLRALVVTGLSKCFAVPGLRCGIIIGSQRIDMSQILSFKSISESGVSQATTAVAKYLLSSPEATQWSKEYAQNIRLTQQRVNAFLATHGIYSISEGGMYVWIYDLKDPLQNVRGVNVSDGREFGITNASRITIDREISDAQLRSLISMD